MESSFKSKPLQKSNIKSVDSLIIEDFLFKIQTNLLDSLLRSLLNKTILKKGNLIYNRKKWLYKEKNKIKQLKI